VGRGIADADGMVEALRMMIADGGIANADGVD
jgi:hypothetical protein